MPTLARLRSATLLLLAACGPGRPESDDGSDAGSGTDSSLSDSSTTNNPTDAPTGGSTGDATTDEPRGSRLIGLAFEKTTQLWDTVELDPATGELIVLDTLPASIQSIRQGSGAFDPATRRIFQLTVDADIFTLDGDSGAFLGVTPLQSDDLTIVGNLELNNAGELVGLAVDDDTIRTIVIDPDTGAVTPLATLPPGLGTLAEGTSAFDPATDRMFDLNEDGHLLVIDAAAGTLIGDAAVMPGGATDLLELEVNNAGELVSLNVPASPGPWEIVRVDPLTGVVTVLDHLSTPGGVVHGQILHDPALDHVFVMTSDDRLHVLDGSSGAELSTITIVPGDHIGLLNPELVP